MNKKTLIILLAAISVLLACIVAAIAVLYSGDGKETDTGAAKFLDAHPLIAAVPSDAALVFCVKDFARAEEYLSDSTALFGTLMSGRLDGLFRYDYPALGHAEAVMSLHYSKDFAPLLVLDTGKESVDTTGDVRKLLDAAGASRLHVRTEGGRIFLSTSETIIHSALRHLSGGLSVLDSDDFPELAAKMEGDDILFVSNAYAGSLLDAFFQRRLRPHAFFFGKVARWSALGISSHSGKGVSLDGTLLDGEDPSYYLNVLRSAGPSSVGVADVLPARVDFAVSLPVKDIASYIRAYRNHLDARSSLEKYKAALDAQKSATGTSAEEWAERLGIQEIAAADLHVGNALHRLLLIKAAKQRGKEGVQAYSCKDFAKTLFGGIFTAEDEDACVLVKGWIVAGSRSVLEAILREDLFRSSLRERLAKAGLAGRIPDRDCGFFMYHSLSEDPTLLERNFRPGLAKALRRTLDGVTFVPATLSMDPDGGTPVLHFSLDRVKMERDKADPASRDTVVAVPEGPFSVTNSATGRKNTFYQNSHLSLCLRDENGKDLWGIPFKEPLCGHVEEVDYYNNGKIQFLFAAGSKLYLVDRLGRFVSGFPVDLGKDVAVGPEVYDFTGARGYSALVLHRDNTVGLYDLHGKPRKDWKGITAKETIKALPELVEAEGRRYWRVRTSLRTLVFPFNGGDPVDDKRILKKITE